MFRFTPVFVNIFLILVTNSDVPFFGKIILIPELSILNNTITVICIHDDFILLCKVIFLIAEHTLLLLHPPAVLSIFTQSLFLKLLLYFLSIWHLVWKYLKLTVNLLKLLFQFLNLRRNLRRFLWLIFKFIILKVLILKFRLFSRWKWRTRIIS